MNNYFQRFCARIADDITPERGMWVTLAVFLVLVGTFFTGFYWGHKKAAQELMFHIEQESFSDKVISSLCTLYDADEEEASQESATEQISPVAPLYYAELAGFSSEQKAQNYVQHLLRDGLQAEVQKRKGIGKAPAWYQVVTQALQKNELEHYLSLIAQRDHLKKIKIHELPLERSEA